MKLIAWNMSDGMVEIHKAGCNHRKSTRNAKGRSRQDQVEFGRTDWASQYDFAHDYWDNGILDEYEMEYGEGSFDVFQEMDFMPCTKGLPRHEYAAEVAAETPLAAYAGKEITETIREYAAWLTEQTGYEVDLRTVALAGTLRDKFQKSRRVA